MNIIPSQKEDWNKKPCKSQIKFIQNRDDMINNPDDLKKIQTIAAANLYCLGMDRIRWECSYTHMVESYELYNELMKKKLNEDQLREELVDLFQNTKLDLVQILGQGSQLRKAALDNRIVSEYLSQRDRFQERKKEWIAAAKQKLGEHKKSGGRQKETDDDNSDDETEDDDSRSESEE